jgi:hypothetical protein
MVTIDITQPPYNAVNDGTTDCTQAITNALQQLLSTSRGGNLYAPGGGYSFNESFTYTLQPGQTISLIGDGSGSTIFKSVQDGAGFNFSYPSGVWSTAGRVSAKGMTFKTTVSNGGNALSLISNNSPNPGPVKDLEDIVICGVGTGYWTNGIVLDGCTYPTLSKIKVEGYAVNNTFYGNGILIQNSQTAHSVASNMDLCNFWNTATGISATDKVEGIQVLNSSFLGQNGIKWVGGTSGLPSLIVGDCDFDCFGYGINTTNIVQLQIHDNEMYIESGGVGIFANNNVNFGTSDRSSIHHNTLIGFNNKTTNGIVYSKFGTASINNNTIDNVTTSIWDQGGSSNCRVLDNINTNYGNTDIVINTTSTGTVIRRV